MTRGFTVSVPATSANLGVGFDCLGLALELSNRFTFTPAAEPGFTGCEERFASVDTSLVWQTYASTLVALGRDAVPMTIGHDCDIPLSGGLGSSSTCVVAGVMAALYMAGEELEPLRVVDIATAIEGHPDNVAPATLGGLTSSFVSDGEVVTIRKPVHSEWRFTVVAPPYEVRTEEARRVLPAEVPLSTAVWQMGRVPAVIQALMYGDAELLGKACVDKLHEPYRKGLIKDYDRMRLEAAESGATCFWISGSGSSMIACSMGAQTAARVEQQLRDTFPRFWIRTIAANGQGATLAEL
jgi:homoserine kinase